eukprot:10151102-Ditylum_brightwellii.AAC.1
MQMPQRKLDQLGCIKAYCGLSSSITEINRQEDEMKESKNEEEKKELGEKAPEARSKLIKKGGDLK